MAQKGQKFPCATFALLGSNFYSVATSKDRRDYINKKHENMHWKNDGLW